MAEAGAAAQLTANAVWRAASPMRASGAVWSAPSPLARRGARSGDRQEALSGACRVPERGEWRRTTRE
jgi:hypothetical protein